jgi:hypothetical protein
MPRFYFDTTDTGQATLDDEGLDLSTIEEARHMALRALADLANDELPNVDRRDFTITVRDDTGKALLTAILSLRLEWLA